MTDAIYCVLLLVCELGALGLGWRTVRWLWLAAAQPVAVVGLAWLLGEDQFGAMRLVAQGVFLHAPFFVLLLGLRLRAASRALPVVAIAAAASLLAIGWDAFYVEPHALQITRVPLTSDKITRRIRIVVIADLQMRELGEYEREALRRALAEAPDLVLLTGDYVQADSPRAERAGVRDLGRYLASIQFTAPLGVFVVGGDMEDAGWPASFEPVGAVLFEQTDSVSSGELRITGLSLHDSFDSSLTVKGSPAFHIVFGHAPDFALGQVGGDLLIAGHTHGGQVRLPWFGPIITYSRVPRAWAEGVTQLAGGRTLVVSRGIGLERGNAPALRFLCRPEIVIVELAPRDFRASEHAARDSS